MRLFLATAILYIGLFSKVFASGNTFEVLLHLVNLPLLLIGVVLLLVVTGKALFSMKTKVIVTYLVLLLVGVIGFLLNSGNVTFSQFLEDSDSIINEEQLVVGGSQRGAGCSNSKSPFIENCSLDIWDFVGTFLLILRIVLLAKVNACFGKAGKCKNFRVTLLILSILTLLISILSESGLGMILLSVFIIIILRHKYHIIKYD